MSEFTGSYEAIVVGASSGGIEALEQLLSGLPADFPVPVAAVQHIPVDSPPASLPKRFQQACQLEVSEAEAGEGLLPGHVYFAPPGYHLLIEKTRVFALDSGERENYARPSIDALFTTAAEAYTKRLIGIVLTGANNDGAEGLRYIRQLGGFAVVQSPSTAHAPTMPTAALSLAGADAVLPLPEIPLLLRQLCGREEDTSTRT
jgi:two-component system chemotaxis response regulator CheB